MWTLPSVREIRDKMQVVCKELKRNCFLIKKKKLKNGFKLSFG